MYRKNTAGQFVCVQLLLTATGAVATGLSPSVRRCIDGTFAAGGGTVTEDGSTGSYKYAMAQADTNGNDISLIFTATGAMPVCINFVTTAADPTDSVRLGLTALPNAAASAVGGLPVAVDTSGRVDVLKINGTSQTARDIGASVITASGTVTTVTNQLTAAQIATGVWQDTTAGDFTVASSIGKSLFTSGNAPGAASGLALVGSNMGTISGALTGAQIATAVWTDTTAGDFTTALSIGKSVLNGVSLGTGLTINGYTGNTVQTGDAYARLGAPAGASTAADVAAIKAVLPTALTGGGNIKADAIAVGGTSQTGRDIGASVLISSGTGTGQLDVTTGVIKANLAQILGTALTETAGLLAAGFKQFFNISSPTSTMNTITTVTTATNLTNAATSGDLTATMKTSVTTAATAATPIAASVTGNVGGNVVGSVASVTARVTANTDQFNGDATAAANIAKTTRAIGRGTVSGSPSVTSIPTSAFAPAGAVADQFKGRIITFDADTTTSALRGQATDITANTSSATPTFTVTALTTAPAVGDTFSVT